MTKRTKVLAEKWWHAYSAVVAHSQWGEDVHALAIYGDSTMSPDEVAEKRPEYDTDEAHFVYVGSWDHDPTDAEKEAVTPEEYRD